VVARLTGSRIAGLALLALLLFCPSLYFGDELRVFRDVFYTSLTLALVAAVLALSGRVIAGPLAIGLAGGLGAWWWLTREEGVWLLPTLLLLALIPLTGGFSDEQRPRGLREMLTRLLPAGAAFGMAMLLVGGVAATNAAVYGRFVVNEIKDASFEGALQALQAAAAPYADERVPVPAHARVRIAAVSPAFASIRGLGLDGPLAQSYRDVGCQVDRRICGDLGGGWFFWALRDAAAAAGHHKSPGQAAAFYGRIEREVEQACDSGRLTCVAWHVPLVPPMKASQLDDVERSAIATADVLTFGVAVWSDALPSDLAAPDGEALYAFLNRPNYRAARVQRTVTGWYAGAGDRWFEVLSEAGKLSGFQRSASPDIAVAFNDPAMSRQRFTFSMDCPSGHCPAVLRFGNGESLRVDLNAMATGGRPAGGGTFYVDAVGPGAPKPLLKARFSDAWVGLAVRLNPLFRLVALLGVAGAVGAIVHAAIARRVTPLAVISVALAGAIAARILILALIDALSFPAANPVYAQPAIPLLLLLTVIVSHAAISGAGGRVRRR
jgi:hypothetical protein